MKQSDLLGTEKIPKLIRSQSIPAAIGILTLSIYGIVDTAFVGQYVGPIGIAAITVVLPITFLIGSIGMSIGVGGASIISRSLGEGNTDRADLTFGNQIALTAVIATLVVILGYFYQDQVLNIFGGRGEVLQPSKTYFNILLISIPFLAFAMMSNNVIRAEGAPKVAMMIMIVPAIVNLILDPIFIVWFKWGLAGAAWATAISYIFSASYGAFYLFFGKSELTLKFKNFLLNGPIVGEIFSIGSVTLARQGVISLLSIVLNNTLYNLGGSLGLSVYGIINRLMLFVNFPVLGITQGFLPIAGYNYGATHWSRVKEVIKKSIYYGTGLAAIIFVLLMVFTPQIVKLFTTDTQVISETIPAMRLAFLATPLICIQLIGPAYFQAIGKALPALGLTLLKQGFFLIPLILLLPKWFGINGIWYAFPIADMMAALVSFVVLRSAITSLTKKELG